MSDRMPERMSYKMTECIYIYICHIEWMSDRMSNRMSNRISWFMPDRKSNRASEYINISAIYNPRWYVRNCVRIASRVASLSQNSSCTSLGFTKGCRSKKLHIHIYIYTYDDNMPVIVSWRGSIVYATNVWSIFLPWIKSWFHQRASNDRTVKFVG